MKFITFLLLNQLIPMAAFCDTGKLGEKPNLEPIEQKDIAEIECISFSQQKGQEKIEAKIEKSQNKATMKISTGTEETTYRIVSARKNKETKLHDYWALGPNGKIAKIKVSCKSSLARTFLWEGDPGTLILGRKKVIPISCTFKDRTSVCGDQKSQTVTSETKQPIASCSKLLEYNDSSASEIIIYNNDEIVIDQQSTKLKTKALEKEGLKIRGDNYSLTFTNINECNALSPLSPSILPRKSIAIFERDGQKTKYHCWFNENFSNCDNSCVDGSCTKVSKETNVNKQDRSPAVDKPIKAATEADSAQ